MTTETTSLNTPANRAWLTLLAATGITWWLGESGAAGSAGLPAVLVMFGLACFKGFLVIRDFMELREAPLLWKLLLTGWLVFVPGMIVLAYWIGSHS